jgi:hypothetical protein
LTVDPNNSEALAGSAFTYMADYSSTQKYFARPTNQSRSIATTFVLEHVSAELNRRIPEGLCMSESRYAAAASLVPSADEVMAYSSRSRPPRCKKPSAPCPTSARAGWAALRQFRFRDSPLWGGRRGAGRALRGTRASFFFIHWRERRAGDVDHQQSDPLGPAPARFSFPSGLAGPAAHETLLLCGRVVRHRGRDSLGAIKPEF